MTPIGRRRHFAISQADPWPRFSRGARTVQFDHGWATGRPVTGRRMTGLAAWGNPLARPSDKYLPLASALLLFIWMMLVPFLLAHAFVAAADAGRAAAAEGRQLITTQATLLRATQPRYDSRGLV